MENVEKILSELPPAARKELLDYAEFLMKKYKKKGKKFTFSWEGKLKDIKMSSVELQRRPLEWRKDVSG
ncbi:DUF2281 domain-containing protein [Thermococcus sp. Bubb.Bath]|uniref:DUF2281 domain-containing protein n=1 Tax=Thermococcus sp. Bubb.Bath TaxID=1638242 RepID=UPI00143A31D8|nr:DUF2281 domain-containing protein [Thermococcus sp. Bubb.Bath]NJF25657.1 DUF2281 domain-containing protein [Thermococcus sp. Bubb.Bath]